MRRVFLLVLVVGLCAVMVGAALAVLPPGGSFTDDDGNIHEASIEAIAAESITKGCNPPTNDRYCPSNSVTRGQMAAFLVRALGLTDRLDDPFYDDDDSIFEADIERLAAAGITRGCNPPTNDRYCPDSRVTRGQMAAFLVRALGYTDSGVGDLFVDDDGSVFEADIDRLGTAGVTRGCNPPTNDRYCPDSPVLRDQMASFLTRALKLTPITPPPPDSTTTSTTGGSTGTTLPEVGQTAIFTACDTATTGIEFSLDQRCVTATVYNSAWANALFTDFYYRWLGPDGQPVDDCTTTNCKVMDFHYKSGFLLGWSMYFYVDGENRDAGWHSIEIWEGSSLNPLRELRLRDNFKLSSIPPVPPTTTTTTTTTTTIPPADVSWDCATNPAGSRTCSGNTDVTDALDESWTCTPDDPADPVDWGCVGDIDKRQAGDESWQCNAYWPGDKCYGNIDTSTPESESWDSGIWGTQLRGYGDIDPGSEVDEFTPDERWVCDLTGTGLVCEMTTQSWKTWTCTGNLGGSWSCAGNVGRLAPVVGPIPGDQL